MYKKIKPVLETLSTVLVMVAAAALIWQMYRQPRPPEPPPPVEDVKLSLPTSAVRHVRGAGSVVLVEFADYECPFCGRHASIVGPEIEREFVESGQIQKVFLNFPLPIHPRAQKAGEAGECAAQQGLFWEMHKRLFDGQSALEVPHLVAHAIAIGLDEETFTACLESGNTAKIVRADMEEGRRLGVFSTPLFFVGVQESNDEIALLKRINGAFPLEIFKEAITDVSAHASRMGETARLSAD